MLRDLKQRGLTMEKSWRHLDDYNLLSKGEIHRRTRDQVASSTR
jgi:hypothetical protein